MPVRFAPCGRMRPLESRCRRRYTSPASTGASVERRDGGHDQRARSEAGRGDGREQAPDRVGIDAVDRLEQPLGGLDRQRRRAALEARRGQDPGARLRMLAQVGAREPGVEQAAVGGVPREPDGVGGGRHAGPAPFVKGMPVWNSVARERSPSCGRSSDERHDADALGLAGAGRAVDLDQMAVRDRAGRAAPCRRAGDRPRGRRARPRTRRASRRAGRPRRSRPRRRRSGAGAARRVSRSNRCSWRSPRLSQTVGKPTSGTASRSQPKSRS